MSFSIVVPTLALLMLVLISRGHAAHIRRNMCAKVVESFTSIQVDQVQADPDALNLALQRIDEKCRRVDLEHQLLLETTI